MHGEHEHVDLQALRLDVLQKLQAAGAMQRDVHDGDVRLGLQNQAHGIADVVRLTADSHAEITVNELAQMLAKHGMVFHEEDFVSIGFFHFIFFHGFGWVWG